MILLGSCSTNDPKPAAPPSVVTSPVVDKTYTWTVDGIGTYSWAFVGGVITSNDKITITSRGVVVSDGPFEPITPATPYLHVYEVADTIPAGETGEGAFDVALFVEPERYYWLKAFVIYTDLSTGTQHSLRGQQVMLQSPPYTLKDIDGNDYTPLILGTQTWLRENLETAHYANGDVIAQPGADWGLVTTSTGGWCNYNDDPAAGYGKLYNAYAVSDPRGLCPTGWHVATDVEWTALENFMGGSGQAGSYLKSPNDWTPPNILANSLSEFSALPGGNRRGADVSIYETLGTMGRFWTATEVNADEALAKDMVNNAANVGTNTFNKRYGFSVRCVKD